MGKIRTLIEILGLSAISYKIGSMFGKALHDYLVYIMPLQYNLTKNFTQYVQLYKRYSNGLDKVFEEVFGLTTLGLTLASYVYIKMKHKHI